MPPSVIYNTLLSVVILHETVRNGLKGAPGGEGGVGSVDVTDAFYYFCKRREVTGES